MNTTDPIIPQLRRNRAACAAVTMVIILAVIWIVQFANVADHYSLDPSFGIQPHVLTSLPDIFAAPFLHGSWARTGRRTTQRGGRAANPWKTS